MVDEYVCDCGCPCGILVENAGDLCTECLAENHCPEMERFDPDAVNKFDRENPREDI